MAHEPSIAVSLVRSLRPWFAWGPPWVFSLFLMAAAVGLGLAAYEVVVRVLQRTLSRRDSFWCSLIVRTRGLGRLALILAGVGGATSVAPLRQEAASLMGHALGVAYIVLAGWAALTALDIAAALYMRNFKLESTDNLMARKHLTQVRILRRAVSTLIILVTAGLALMTIPAVRQLGVSLLAAGGAAGILVGLALQPLFSNMMAGLQIAMTQPIRIDDALFIQGEWGTVEEITSAYVVVRLWDLRRMIVPLKYFLDQPFQNWTRESSSLIGTVLIYVDYTVPVERLRAKLKEIAQTSSLWDGHVQVLQVTDAKERTVELRCLVSAANAGQTWDLRCEVREKMIAYLQAEFPDALPRERVEVSPSRATEPCAEKGEGPPRRGRP